MRERKIEKYLIKSPKQMIMVIAVFTLMIFVGGTTYAFFNYTRTGSANTVSVGRISFVTRQTKTISLNNLFPIDPTDTEEMSDATKVGTLEIEIVGDTDYAQGVEYLVSSENTHITTSTGKVVPISLDVAVTNLGTASPNYFTSREDKDATIYKKLVGDTLVGDQMLLVGYIKPNTTAGNIEGVNGKLTIKAYLDENKILISDTYDGTESDNMGTPNEVARGKTVLTTTEWNALSSSGISFQINVEANEGIWVKGSLEEIMRKESIGIDTENGVDFSKTSDQDGTKGVYMRAGTQNDAYPIVYYRGAVEDNNVVFNNKCWKAVRTTDTGGVKLIYNGELSDTYGSGDTISRASYTNVSTPVNAFTYDTSDNSWNITITDGSNPSISFNVPAGDNYKLVQTGTSGSSCGGSFNFYKNGTSVNGGSNGGGGAMNLTHNFGTLTSTDVIKMNYLGSSSSTCEITFKLIMQQNGSAISQSNYTIVGESFTFDETTQIWSSTVEPNKQATIGFNVSVAGDYFINFTNPNGGQFYIYRNGTVVSTASGTQKAKLLNLQTTDKIVVDYSQYNTTSNGKVEFYLTEAENLGLGCGNTGIDTRIDVNGSNLMPFSGNLLYKSPAYVGYMWGTVYEYSTENWRSGAKFGSGFTWDGTNYKLTDATVTTPNDTHHYSCNSTDAEATCTSIRYVYWVNESNKYYITISDGKGIEEAIKDMQTNTNPSNAKTQIDSWYASNMNTVTSKLEDTIWCNDRSIGRYNGWSATGTINGSDDDYKNYSLLFGAYERSNYASGTSTVKNQPSLACANKNDAFTVNNGNGNQKLTYPVALLTEDEMVLAGGLAGSQSQFYLNNGSTYFWSLSPSYFNYNYASEFRMDNGNINNYLNVMNPYGLRPSVSLKPGMPVISGEGTVTSPYRIGS